ncbi:hypothetical protein ACWC4D_08500 [Streptomyces sp. NPDC001288]|uniref:hypothetical protein n=2 Tax=unclassified Streptomyces TaxID=2593676 RepID=UPI0036757ABC
MIVGFGCWRELGMARGKRFTATERRRPTKGKIATAVLIAGLLALSALGVRNLLYAAGWAGTSGTYRASSCEFSGSLSKWECSGTFVSDDGRIEDPRAGVDLGSDGRGRAVRVERTGLSGYQEVGGIATVEAIALILFGAVPVVVAGGFELRKRRRSARRGS